MNANFVDMASNGLSAVLTRDGQSSMTGQFKAANGTVSLPALTFASDLNTGFYRIGPDNIGAAVGGTKIVDISSTGLSVTGALTPSGAFTAPDGTVSLPGYSFTNDLDSGMYRIGANNLGVAVNATKILDISTTGLNVIGTVSSNGSIFSPLPQGVVMVNGTITEAHVGNAVTFAIKTLAGNDPSASDPVFFIFRNVTAATGNYSVVQATAAMSIVISSGSTLGIPSGASNNVWIAVFNDGGTLRLGVINCRNGTSVYALSAWGIASSTAEGGIGGADTAMTFYTGTAVSSKAYGVLGYASYQDGLAVAGAWDVSPTRLQLYGIGVHLPGESFNPQQNYTGAAASGTETITVNDSIPAITDGKEYMTQAHAPSSKANLWEFELHGQFASSGGVGTALTMILCQGGVTNSLAAASTIVVNANSTQLRITFAMLCSTTSSTTFSMRAGSGGAATTTFNGNAGARFFGGVSNSFMRVKEIMA
jgi:hypothetical protein